MAFKSLICSLVPAFAAAMLFAAPAPAQQVEGIAAVVNDEPITTLDVRNRMMLILTSAGIQPDEETLARIQEQALDGLIEETLQLQSARDFEVEVEEEEVTESLRDIAARNGSTLEEIDQDLASAGVDIETLRHQIRAEIAWQILVNGRYGSRVRVSDNQIEVARERVIEGASEPQVRLGEILIEAPGSGDTSQAEATIQTVFQQLSQGAPFPAVARQFSAAPSASAGGDTGWQAISQLSPQVQQIIAQFSQPGQISRPVRVPGGYLIVALIDRRDSSVVEQLELIQITLPGSRITEDARTRLSRAVGSIESCDAVEARVENIEGVLVTDLGTIGANALVDTIRNAVTGLEPVEATPLLETAAGLQSFVLCGRSVEGAGIPSEDQMEDQLRGQQLSLLSRRWLRDLRREATIEIR
ncbi:peptidylprolyl isomerase [Marinicauda pacifica]|uniref:peptidylprolyl isomerase n=1 Tax=Marinicauda pacifica TaxID=1133559 RepID=UPI0035C8415D